MGEKEGELEGERRERQRNRKISFKVVNINSYKKKAVPLVKQ